jgi:hypothetical protein
VFKTLKNRNLTLSHVFNRIQGRTLLPLSLFALILFGFSESGWAVHDIFANPTTKATFIQAGAVTFGKVLVGLMFVGSAIGALAGRINWRWVAIIFAVGVVLVTVDKITNFMMADNIVPQQRQ